MPRVAIVTDSVACLTREHIKRYGIRIVPIKILFGNKVFRDSIDLTIAEAYQLLDKAPELFATSPSPPADYIGVFGQPASAKQDILFISVSSKLSTAINMANVAKEHIRQEFPETRIEVLDSYSAVAGQGLIVMAAAKLAAEGKGFDQVLEVAQLVKERVRVLLVFETIRHVYRTGRIPQVASRIGSMLGVKPIVNILDGRVRFIGVSRTKQGGVNRILKMMQKEVGQKPANVAVMNADVPEEGQRLKERVAAQFNCQELITSEFSPIIGYATGRGVLGVAYYATPDDS